MTFQELHQLRARFSLALSQMYGKEVPAYTTLVEVSTEVNERYVAAHPEDAERLGSISRVTAERHGAIRVGSHKEIAQAARIFAGFGMYPVGFYDLREAAKSSVPVVSTAFRPVDRDELAKNPFRLFTSMLTTNDPRFFNEELQKELTEFIENRTLFSDRLLELADKSSEQGGLEEADADEFLKEATAAFELSDEPVDHEWYMRLEKISAVASDIGGVVKTHINHLTPRVLDIDDLYASMEKRGIKMIDEIQGPPRWEGADVLLRQTSFRALDEPRIFRFADGTVGPGELRVRFGEVEQRGIALTPAGRDLYDSLLAEVDRRLSEGEGGGVRVEVAKKVWEENLPATEKELDEKGLAYFTYELAEGATADLGDTSGPVNLQELIEQGIVERHPIVYEDFLPRSAAGIFQSNLKEEGSRDDKQAGTDYDINVFSEIIGRPVADPYELYRKQSDESLEVLSQRLGVQVER